MNAVHLYAPMLRPYADIVNLRCRSCSRTSSDVRWFHSTARDHQHGGGHYRSSTFVHHPGWAHVITRSRAMSRLTTRKMWEGARVGSAGWSNSGTWAVPRTSAGNREEEV